MDSIGPDMHLKAFWPWRRCAKGEKHRISRTLFTSVPRTSYTPNRVPQGHSTPPLDDHSLDNPITRCACAIARRCSNMNKVEDGMHLQGPWPFDRRRSSPTVPHTCQLTFNPDCIGIPPCCIDPTTRKTTALLTTTAALSQFPGLRSLHFSPVPDFPSPLLRIRGWNFPGTR
jgi:hypothetical protein